MNTLTISFITSIRGTQDIPQWVVALFFFGPLVLGIAYLIYMKTGEAKWKRGTFPMKLPITRSNYLEAHICLAAYFIQRDRNALKEKVDFLSGYFQRHFRNEYYDFQESLKSSYEYPITPVSVAKWVHSKNVSSEVREQLLVFLIEFCGIDGLIVDKEYVLLKQVAHTLGFDETHFQRLLSENGPKIPEPSRPTSSSTLRARFAEVLGIAPTASKPEIKNAYRSLAKKYHPDKFVDADEAQRQRNQAVFIAIQEAYDYLYERAG